MYPSPFVAEIIPILGSSVVPPLIHGTAVLAHRAYRDHGLADLLGLVDRPAITAAERAAVMLDRAQVHALRFRGAESASLQSRALAIHRLFRVADGFVARSDHPLRVLALVAPGDLMVNTPLDFITGHLDVQLDLLFVVPGRHLPARLPDHDVAFFAVSESDPATLNRLRVLHAAWPRPVLNNPAAIARLTRDTVAEGLAAVPGVCSPPALLVTRARLLDHLASRSPIPLLDRPALIRPAGAHGGQGLVKCDTVADLAAYLEGSEADSFFVTRFVDYRGANQLFQKYRVAVIDGVPFLCHMATSPHWMVHYLNAGMTESASRRAEEAAAMATFDRNFASRHAAAFAGLNAWMGLDYFQLDCAETRDGRLLVFEVDVAAIVHLMDPPELFPYKPAPMHRLFAAFDRMLRRRAGLTQAGLAPAGRESPALV